MKKITILKVYKHTLMIKKITIFLVPVLFLFSFLPSFVYADLVDVIIDRSPASVGSPQIPADGGCNVYDVWKDNLNGGSR
jgi:hypothetical protein